MKATDILMDEHRLIEQVLECLEDAALRLEDGEDISAEFFIDAAEFIQGYADGSHHRKEEDILFTAMTAKDMPGDFGPVGVMLSEHEEGRRLTAGFLAAARALGDGDAGAAAEIAPNALGYVNLLREHIFKEDNVLYPMAEQLLDAADQQQMSRQFEQILADDLASGHSARVRELVAKLKAA